MKNNFKSLVFILALGIILGACKDNNKNPSPDDKSVVIKTDEEIESDNIKGDFYEMIGFANSNLADEDKKYLANFIKNMEEKNTEEIAKFLTEPIKSEVGGDLRVINYKLDATYYSGPILDIKEVNKDGENFHIVAEGDSDNLDINLSVDKDKNIKKFDIKLLSTIGKHKDLMADHQAFIDKSYHILDSVIEGDKEAFREDLSGLNLTDEKYNEVYEGLAHDINLSGSVLEKSDKAYVHYGRDLIENAPVDENLVEVDLTYKYERIEKIVYSFVYTEDKDLVSLEIGSGD